jgi:hypothetical protein
MRSWGGDAADARLAYSDDYLAKVLAAAERLANARDELRPRTGDERPGCPSP